MRPLYENTAHLTLDPFCGCGTTIHAAQKLDRQWIGIDVAYLDFFGISKGLFGVNEGLCGANKGLFAACEALFAASEGLVGATKGLSVAKEGLFKAP